jgi:pimeloyl-ACP methyl ester carboxylesterase
MVLLHGGGLTAHTYDLVCLAMRDEYRCYSLDQRGHGDSEWSPEVDYRLESHASDIDAFVRHLGLRNFVLVGMSMGGLNALQWAGEHSAELAALVLIDTGPEFQELGAKRIREFLKQPRELDSIEAYVARAKEFNPRRDERLLRRSLLHNLRQTPRGTWVWKYDPRPREKIDPERQAQRFHRLWEAVDRIECPTLVVRGGDSDVFSDTDADRLVARLKSGRRATVEGAGHTVQGDNPVGLVRELREFLGALPTTSTR